MKWAMLDPAGRPSGFYHPDVHPELFEQDEGEPRPRGPIASAVPVTDADWQELLSHPGRRKLENGRVLPTEPPAPSPDAQAEADRALLREAMLRDQLEDWIEQRAADPAGLSPTELAALQRLRARGSTGRPGAAFVGAHPSIAET
jgi:hypothetical protein